MKEKIRNYFEELIEEHSCDPFSIQGSFCNNDYGTVKEKHTFIEEEKHIFIEEIINTIDDWLISNSYAELTKREKIIIKILLDKYPFNIDKDNG